MQPAFSGYPKRCTACSFLISCSTSRTSILSISSAYFCVQKQRQMGSLSQKEQVLVSQRTLTLLVTFGQCLFDLILMSFATKMAWTFEPDTTFLKVRLLMDSIFIMKQLYSDGFRFCSLQLMSQGPRLCTHFRMFLNYSILSPRSLPYLWSLIEMLSMQDCSVFTIDWQRSCMDCLKLSNIINFNSIKQTQRQIQRYLIITGVSQEIFFRTFLQLSLKAHSLQTLTLTRAFFFYPCSTYPKFIQYTFCDGDLQLIQPQVPSPFPDNTYFSVRHLHPIWPFSNLCRLTRAYSLQSFSQYFLASSSPFFCLRSSLLSSWLSSDESESLRN